MKFIKSLICNYLCINRLHNINRLGVSKFKSNNFEKKYPTSFFSFKKTKMYYLENNIYYDIYRDSLQDVNNLFFNTNYSKYKFIINKNNKNNKINKIRHPRLRY